MIEIDMGSLNKAKKRVWVKPTAKKVGYYRMQEVGVKEEEKEEKPSKSDITDKYDVSLDTLKFNSIRFLVGEDEIYVSREVGYFPKAGGQVTYFEGKVVIGREDWIGKDIKEIPEIVGEVNDQYSKLEKIKEGGNFSDAKMSEGRGAISNVLQLYKSTVGTTTYVMLLAEAYLKNGTVEIPDINNRADKEYNSLKEYLIKYKDDQDYVDLISEKMAKIEEGKLYNKVSLIGDHESVIAKMDQDAVNEFYSEVNRTQEELREKFKGKDTITLYRGVQGDYAKAIKSGLKKEEEVEIDTYSVTSWTSDETIAHDFSARGKGVVIKKKFSIKDILFSHFTSPYIRTSDYVFGGTEEYEFIVGHRDKRMKVSKEEIV